VEEAGAWPKQRGCAEPPFGRGCATSPLPALPGLRRPLASGYGERVEDAVRGLRVPRAADRPWSRVGEPVSRALRLVAAAVDGQERGPVSRRTLRSGYAVSERTSTRRLPAVGSSLQSTARRRRAASTRIALRSCSPATGGSRQPAPGAAGRVGREQEKEWVGQFRNGGREGQPLGQPGGATVPDCPDEECGKVLPGRGR
jgi:hypothetical protein